MSWQRSGELIVMVLLGGLGTLNGAIVGTVAYLLLEEWLSGFTENWKVIFGPLLVLLAVFAAVITSCQMCERRSEPAEERVPKRRKATADRTAGARQAGGGSARSGGRRGGRSVVVLDRRDRCRPASEDAAHALE